MKKILILSFLTVASLVSAQTPHQIMSLGQSYENSIEASNCDIYLPVTSEITSWGAWQQKLIDKGYTPIEIKTIDQIPNNALVGGLSYNFSSNSSFGKSSKCTVEMSVKELVNKSDLKMKTLFTKKKVQKRMTIFNTKVNCKKAERKVQRAIPNCKLK